MSPDHSAIQAEILRQTAARGPDKSICPSEVARALAGNDETAWRALLGPVRQAATGLVQAGRIDILRKGRPIAPDEVRGVIRFRGRA